MTITKRLRRDGSIAYKAEVRKMHKGRTFQRTRTFDKWSDAKAWETRTTAELQEAEDLSEMAHEGIRIGQIIDAYLEDFGEGFGRTKAMDIQALRKSKLAEQPAIRLKAGKIVDHVRERRKTVAPSTALNDLIWLRAVWRYGRTAKGIALDLTPIEAATEFCRAEKLIGKPRVRERRPTPDEMDALTSYFEARRTQIPMSDIMWFAVHSARRQAEICRLLWSDNNNEETTGLVRDAKHPRTKEGNHRRFKYTPEAWEIVQRQAKDNERIFPFNPKTIGAYFTDACHILEIDDLRFHDLRHEATSRLFEAGYSIVEVQQFTLHEDWNTLKRYTHLRPGDVKHR